MVAMAVVQNHKDKDTRGGRGVGKKESLQRELQARADLITDRQDVSTKESGCQGDGQGSSQGASGDDGVWVAY